MRVAVIGSRNLKVDIAGYIPQGTTEIVTGGARGIDRLAERYADEHYIPKLILRPDYGHYGYSAPRVRNRAIVEAANYIVALWDGKSPGTKFTIEYAKRIGKPVKVYVLDGGEQAGRG